MSSTILLAQGIDFNVTSVDAALEKAKAENKNIFVDAYTTWCGPCKWMAINVFTDEKVGSYYNDKFVNLKIDMEKGEGPEYAQAWEIAGYPTLLFLDANGDVIHRSMGSRPAEDFVDLGYAANDPDRQITTMTRRFEAGEQAPDFLKKYVAAMTSAGLKGFEKVTAMYLEKQDDWTTADNIQFIFDYSEASTDSKLFQYTLDNKAEFLEVVGRKKYDQKLAYASDLDRSKAGIARDDVDKLKVHFAKYYDQEMADNMAMCSYFNQLMYTEDAVEQEKFKAEIQLFLAAKPDLPWNFYNAAAWQIYEISDDIDLLRKASEWTDISMDKNRNAHNTDTQAAIQLKLGKKDIARKYAIESIELARQSGVDYSATEALLEKIDKKY